MLFGYTPGYIHRDEKVWGCAISGHTHMAISSPIIINQYSPVFSSSIITPYRPKTNPLSPLINKTIAITNQPLMKLCGRNQKHTLINPVHIHPNAIIHQLSPQRCSFRSRNATRGTVVTGGWNRECWHEDSACRLDLRKLCLGHPGVEQRRHGGWPAGRLESMA